jgi:methyl-accepting chemotaxis protein
MTSNKSPIKLSTRLILGFSATIALGVGVAVYAALTMSYLSDSVNELANRTMLKVAQLNELQDNFNGIARFTRNIILSDDPVFGARQLKLINEKRSRNSELLPSLDRLIQTPKGVEYLRTIEGANSPFNKVMDQVIVEANKGDKVSSAELLIGEGIVLQNKLFDTVDDARKLQQTAAAELTKQANSTASLGKLLMSMLAMLMTCVGSSVCWVTMRNIKRSLGAEPSDLNAMVGLVAAGDLSQRLEVASGDTNSVLYSVVRMQSRLNDVVSAVREGSNTVAIASSQIAQGNLDLSQRTEEQAGSLQETAASMEQLSSTAWQTAANAEEANQLAVGASEVASQGGTVVGRVVETMRTINESSKRITDIIGVIDDIAFQTNILALNAAVEAARAGEQGRGFAVVASEVRSLAQRVAEAAKEIKTLISVSVERVKQGTQLVDQAGVTMTDIVSAIARVTSILGEISSASREQSAGVSQVGQAVTQMDQVTQQNAALVEESAAAAESLKFQTQRLLQAVSVFKLSRSGIRAHQEACCATA